MSDQIKVPTCKHYDMTVAELEADGYAMEDMPLCEMCSYDEIERLKAELEKACDIVEIHDDAVRVFKTDNERLREALEKAQKDCNANAKRNGELLDQHERLREDRKRENWIVARVSQLLAGTDRVNYERAMKRATEEALKRGRV